MTPSAVHPVPNMIEAPMNGIPNTTSKSPVSHFIPVENLIVHRLPFISYLFYGCPAKVSHFDINRSGTFFHF